MINLENSSLCNISELAKGLMFNPFNCFYDENSRPNLKSISSEIIDFPVRNFLIDEMQNCKKENIKNHSSASLNNPLKFTNSKENLLEFNFLLAKELLVEVQKAIPFSPNNLHRSQKFIEEKAKNYGIFFDNYISLNNEAVKLLDEARDLTKNDYYHLKKYCSHYKQYKNIYNIATDRPIGNCGEMSIFALFKGINKGIWNIHLSMATITPGNHEVLVIGREPGSNPSDYKTWGSSAVILDSWAGKIFKASDLEIHLEDFSGVDNKTGKPYMKPFDPKKQKLKIRVENIYTRHDLIRYIEKTSMTEDQIQIYYTIADQLDNFHLTDEMQKKLKIAKLITRICNSQEIGFLKNRILGELKDQIKYFIKLNKLS